MSDFKERLKKEAEELRVKIVKLENWLNSNKPSELKVNPDDLTLMITQLHAMNTYSYILTARLLRLT